jgi:hypothetical protein
MEKEVMAEPGVTGVADGRSRRLPEEVAEVEMGRKFLSPQTKYEIMERSISGEDSEVREAGWRGPVHAGPLNGICAAFLSGNAGHALLVLAAA